MTFLVEFPKGKWHNEKKYVVDCVLRVFLGCDNYIVREGWSNDWVVKKDDDLSFQSLNFPNIFFPESEPHLYLSERHLSSLKSTFSFISSVQLNISNFPSDDIPLIFYNANISTVFDIDIFGTIFFYLTRYEECVSNIFDDLSRFNSRNSMVFNYHARPVVDEYIWILRNEIYKKWRYVPESHANYKFILSHDVDIPHSWTSSNFLTFVRVLIGDLLKRQSINAALESYSSYTNIYRDPVYTFPWLLSQLDRFGVQSTFYFLTGGNHKYDINYDIKRGPLNYLIKQILDLGHQIGLHGSINSANDACLLKSEKLKLEDVISDKINKIRQHYLCFRAPYTWCFQCENGFAEDSSLGYADYAGFRCGTARKFPVFNLFTSANINLIESPLICMEHSLFSSGYQNLSDEQGYEYYVSLVSQVRKFGGDVTLLWHNHNLVKPAQRDLFEQFIKISV